MTRFTTAVTVGLLGVLVVVLADPGVTASASPVPQPAVVAEVPRPDTPEVRDGRVQALADVGTTIVMGGTFTSVSDRGASPVSRTSLAAYDQRTGRLLPAFAPTLDGEVFAVLSGPVADTVYVAGSFGTVNGQFSPRLALLDVRTGQRVTSFRNTGINGPVRTIARSGDRLYLGGTFTKVAGATHAGLASVNAVTGALDPFVNTQFSEHHNYGRVSGSASSPVGVVDLAVTPDGSQMTVIGNFRAVDGLVRDQAAVISLTGSAAAVDTGWATSLFTAPCHSWSFDSWVRDVDYSPDGSYFVVGSTGGGNADLCDVVARFGTKDRGTNIRPTWIASTGGDSVYSVAATGTAIYAGGHFRWFNNPTAVDRAGAGAVPRPGIVALDPATGLPLEWDPGRHPRDKGAFAMHATDKELLVGTDTDWVGNRQYYTPKLAVFPLAGGTAPRDTSTPALPGTIHRVVTASNGTATDTGRPLTVAGAGPVGASRTESALSGTRGVMVVGGYAYVATSDGVLHRRAYDGSSFSTTDQVLDPYHDPKWSTVLTGLGGGTETYAGVPSGLEKSFPTLTSLFFLGGRVYYTVSGSSSLRYRSFETGTGAAHPTEAKLANVSLPSLAGGTYADGNLYYVRASDGVLVRRAFDGTSLSSTWTDLSGPSIDGFDWRSSALYVGAAQKAPTVAISTVPAIDGTNQSAWSVVGTATGTADVSIVVTDGSGTVTTTRPVAADGSWSATLDVSSLSDGSLEVRAVASSTSDGGPDVRETATKETLPSAPPAVTATSTVDRVDVSWARPERSGGLSLTGYRVTISGASGDQSVEVGPGASKASVGGLWDDTEYTASVTALSSAGEGAAGTSATRTRAATGLTLGVATRTVRSGGELALSGQLISARTGEGLPGESITVFGVGSDGRRVRLAGGVSTDADGRWSTVVRPTVSQRYQADFAGDDPLAFSRSAASPTVGVTT